MSDNVKTSDVGIPTDATVRIVTVASLRCRCKGETRTNPVRADDHIGADSSDAVPATRHIIINVQT
ncbi:MAG: hypothetical protein NC344_00270 [Bacteroidales bacterium]|nr:hypothetical protein [Bacteroidales bacterium]MCM1146272.1 hypothetical protein [Bacteroidales bacterium]MCM1205290.1 hypothetical protein [Bacillota bacterium]MCM1509623.1 hypothetical protein [Clostridium sp.]